MRSEILNTFIIATNDILNTEANIQLKRGSLSLERGAYTSEDVTVLISLIGDIWGIAIISLSFDMAKGITSRILGQEFPDFNDLAQSGIGELGNVIVGHVSTKLADLGYHTAISVPTLVVGKGSQISTLGIDRVVIPLQSEFGVFQLNLALREKVA